MEDITANELAKMLDVSSKTVRRKIASGEINAYKSQGRTGMEYRIPAEEVARLTDLPDICPELLPTVQVVTMPTSEWNNVQSQLAELAHKLGYAKGVADTLQKEVNRLQGHVMVLEGEKKKSLWDRLFGK